MLALLHRPGQPAGPWYDDWLALSELVAGAGNVDDGRRGFSATALSANTRPRRTRMSSRSMRWRSGARQRKKNLTPPAPLPEAGRGERLESVTPFPLREGGRGVRFSTRFRLRLPPAPPPPARRRPHLRRPAPRLSAAGATPNCTTNSPALEDRIERFEPIDADIEPLERRAAAPLVERLLGRATRQQARPAPAESRAPSPAASRWSATISPPPRRSAARSRRSSATATLTRLVVEIPALGFAWLEPHSASRRQSARPHPDAADRSGSPTSTGPPQRIPRSRDRPDHRRPAGHPRHPRPGKPPRPATRLPARQQDGRQGNPGHVGRPGPRRDRQHAGRSWTITTPCWPRSASGSASGSAGRCWKCRSN